MLFRFSFQPNKIPELKAYLCENSIPIQVDGNVYSFEIQKNDSHWQNISDILRNSTPRCISDTPPAQDDLSDTEWLRMWCQTRFGYPQPEAGFQYKSITYIRERICPECGNGSTQQDAFRIKKLPAWGRKHFAELNWVYDELFLSDAAKKILQAEQITGITFDAVKNKTGTETLSGINQLRVTYVLKPGIIEEHSDIRSVTVCERCLTKKYLLYPGGKMTMHREIFEGAPDIVKTAEVFGSGRCAVRHTLIRRKVYELLIENQLGRGLVFEPIMLR